MKIGAWTIDNPCLVAPMAGVTDRPFRKLCKRLGASYAVSEMTSSKPELQASLKTQRRLDHHGETHPIAVQIVGVDPHEMAQAARENIERGADVIDINMGCPAKKVCNRFAGSALMQDESEALRIVSAVVAACEPYGIPVTLKMRAGFSSSQKNARSIALAAEAAGVAMITVHGRTRDQAYRGQAEFDTVANVKSAVKIPVVANGDITDAAKAQAVLAYTKADAVMIGRAAMGRPWLFQEMSHFLKAGQMPNSPRLTDVKDWLLEHLEEHYAFYGEYTGVRTARKHLGWYVRNFPGFEAFKAHMNTLTETRQQHACVDAYFEQLMEHAQTLSDLSVRAYSSPSSLAS